MFQVSKRFMDKTQKEIILLALQRLEQNLGKVCSSNLFYFFAIYHQALMKWTPFRFCHEKQSLLSPLWWGFFFVFNFSGWQGKIFSATVIQKVKTYCLLIIVLFFSVGKCSNHQVKDTNISVGLSIALDWQSIDN